MGPSPAATRHPSGGWDLFAPAQSCEKEAPASAGVTFLRWGDVRDFGDAVVKFIFTRHTSVGWYLY